MAKQAWISDEDYTFIYSRVPRLCVDLVIKGRRGMLLSRRDIEPAKGQWHIPGGRVRYGETIAHAAERIANDELGLRIRLGACLGFVECPSEHQNERVVHSVSIVVRAFPLRGKNAVGSWQAGKIGFFKKVPRNTYKPQAKFLNDAKLL